MSYFSPFPYFQKLKLTDKKEYLEYYAGFDAYCDFSINNLWAWFNMHDTLSVAELHGNLVFSLDNPFDHDKHDFSVLGKNKPEHTLHRILRWQKSMGLPAKLIMVPEIMVETLHPHSKSLLILADRDNSDYVCEVERSYDAHGSIYTKYRNAVSNFTRNNAEITIKEIDLSKVDRIEKMRLINTLHRWDSTYRQSEQSRIEGASIDRCLNYSSDLLPVQCLQIYVGNELASFILYHYPPQKDYALGNYLRCNYEFHNIYDFAFSQFIKILHDRGITYANIEQDLGIPGIRKHKEKSNPAFFLNRYTVTLPY